MRVSEAKKASYFFASFLTSFLFLLSLMKPLGASFNREMPGSALTSSNRQRTCTRDRSA